MDAQVRIENRAQLIYLLTEAAELEHGIMCTYLFSAFSMKKDVKEGIAADHLPIVRRWRGTIMQIAIQEMVHMSLACNLLTAVGGAPHLNRPNLPSRPKAYPPSFRLHLEPFCRETLDNFVFIEKPEDLEGGAGEDGDSGPPLQLRCTSPACGAGSGASLESTVRSKTLTYATVETPTGRWAASRRSRYCSQTPVDSPL